MQSIDNVAAMMSVAQLRWCRSPIKGANDKGLFTQNLTCLWGDLLNLYPDMLTAIHSASQLLGNANVKLASLRREVVSSLNKRLLPLVKEENSFSKVWRGIIAKIQCN